MISLPGIDSLIVGVLLTGGGFLSVVQLTLECSRRQAAAPGYIAGCGLRLGAGETCGSVLSAVSI